MIVEFVSRRSITVVEFVAGRSITFHYDTHIATLIARYASREYTNTKIIGEGEGKGTLYTMRSIAARYLVYGYSNALGCLFGVPFNIAPLSGVPFFQCVSSRNMGLSF